MKKMSPGSSWFFLRLEPFTLEATAAPVDLCFEFRDSDNPWWKSGVMWDFIQLRKL